MAEERDLCTCQYGTKRDPRDHQTGVCPNCDGRIAYGVEALALTLFYFIFSSLTFDPSCVKLQYLVKIVFGVLFTSGEN